MKETLPPLLERLTNQLMEKGRDYDDAFDMAKNILWDRGHLKKGTTELTTSGKVRSNMSDAERAIDRRIKERGGRPSDYYYNPATNSALKFKK